MTFHETEFPFKILNSKSVPPVSSLRSSFRLLVVPPARPAHVVVTAPVPVVNSTGLINATYVPQVASPVVSTSDSVDSM